MHGGKQVLTNTDEVLECERYAMDNVWVFFHYCCILVHTKFIVPEACFHTELIHASPIVIAHKMAK